MLTARRWLIEITALAFEGNDKSERINWPPIADVETTEDGIKIQRRTEPKLLVHRQI